MSTRKLKIYATGKKSVENPSDPSRSFYIPSLSSSCGSYDDGLSARGSYKQSTIPNTNKRKNNLKLVFF